MVWEGKYTQILIDSRPIFTSFPSAGVWLGTDSTNMIDRVEVVRGGGSALFGSPAIAGTINIITKGNPCTNSGSLAHTFTNINGSGAFDNNTTTNLSLVSADNRAGLRLRSEPHPLAWDANGDGIYRTFKK